MPLPHQGMTPQPGTSDKLMCSMEEPAVTPRHPHTVCSPHVLIVQVTQHAIASGDEITAVVAFETFLDVLEVPAAWMAAFFPALVKLSVESAANQQLELNTREQALQVMPTSAFVLTFLQALGYHYFHAEGPCHDHYDMSSLVCADCELAGTVQAKAADQAAAGKAHCGVPVQAVWGGRS